MTTPTPQDIAKARELINAWRSGGIDSVASALAAERSRWQEECERLQEVQAELKQAIDLMMQEIVASGNWGAKDFGWPKAIAAVKAVQRHFDHALAQPATVEKPEQ